MQVRRAERADAAALAELASLTFPLACPPHTTDEAKASFIAQNLSREKFEEYLVDPARTLFVAVADDGVTLLGYTMLIAGDPEDADVAAAVRLRPSIELSKCYVHPDAHGAGASSALLAASVAAAVESGAAGMWLGVHQLNARAQRFYTKQGFTRVGTKRFLVGDRYEDDFVFERPLP